MRFGSRSYVGSPRSLQVPEDIHKQYMNGGRAEKAKLLKMFVDSGFDKALGSKPSNMCVWYPLGSHSALQGINHVQANKIGSWSDKKKVRNSNCMNWDGKVDLKP